MGHFSLFYVFVKHEFKIFTILIIKFFHQVTVTRAKMLVKPDPWLLSEDNNLLYLKILKRK